MALGLHGFGRKVGFSPSAQRRPWLTRLLIAFLRAENLEHQFTTIQVNATYASRPLVDNDHLGSSLIVGLGDYEGGELWVHDDDGDVEFTLREGIKSQFDYHAGTTWRGRNQDIRGKLCNFNGKTLHYTLPFTGTRFSLVYYTCNRYAKAPEEARDTLEKAGFDFSWENPELEQGVEQKKEEPMRLAKAERRAARKKKQRPDRGIVATCLARTWNQGWGGGCGKPRVQTGDFCAQHCRTWQTHGRVDGVAPPTKLEQMRKAQTVLLSRDARPPPEGTPGMMLLVQLPEASSIGDLGGGLVQNADTVTPKTTHPRAKKKRKSGSSSDACETPVKDVAASSPGASGTGQSVRHRIVGKRSLQQLTLTQAMGRNVVRRLADMVAQNLSAFASVGADLD